MGLLQLCLAVAVCLQFYLNGSEHYNGQSTFLPFVRQPFIRKHFLKRRISYTCSSNCNATFQIELLRDGDVDPNPGPDQISSTPRLHQSSSSEQGIKYKYTPTELRNLKDRKYLLPETVLRIVNELHINRRSMDTPRSFGFNRKKRTRRGTRGGKGKEVRDISSTNSSISTQSNYLKLCTVNVRSVRSKSASVFDFVNESKADLYAMTETWLTDNDSAIIHDIVPPGHRFVHCPRTARRGGGTALLFKDTLDVHQVLADEYGERLEDEDEAWWYAEVFQIILKTQVNALINMGVTDRLREVVEQMWFRFLQNSKWAFVKKQSKQLKNKNGKPKKGQQPSQIQQKQEGEEEMNATWKKSKNVPADGELVKKNKFRLQHLLGILYAAMRFIGEPILISDLIRWALNGHLPYYGTNDLLPKHLTHKFGSSGSHLFVVAKPDVLHVSKLQEPVFHVLSVLDVPALDQIKMDLVISRFICSLNLPASFHQMSHYLMTKHPLTNNYHKNKNAKRKRFEFEEGPSLAYIVVAMKLLFGLDGHTEMISSEIGRSIRTKLPPGSNVAPFIWDEWRTGEKLRAKHHLINNKIVNSQACRQVSDVPRFINQHTKAFLLNSKRESLNQFHKYQSQSLGSEMQRPFLKLRDQDEPSSLPYTMHGPSSFPYTLSGLEERLEEQPNTGMSDSRLDHGDPLNPSVTHYISKREMTMYDFSKTSVDYLVNLTKFCKKYGVDIESVLSQVNDERPECRAAKRDADKAGSGFNDNQSHKDGVCVSQQRERKRKRTNKESKRAATGKSQSSQDEEDGDLVGSSGDASKKVRLKKKKKTLNANKAAGDQRKTLNGAGSDKSDQTNLEELPYEQWKQMVLSRTSTHDPSHSVCHAELRTYSVPYTRYKALSVLQSKASREIDGEASVWTPFHQPYQWLLQHCAALFGLDWIYIHEAVAVLENQIFEL